MTKTLDRTTAPHDHPIDTRLKISALWTAMLFIFAYVDLFSLYLLAVVVHHAWTWPERVPDFVPSDPTEAVQCGREEQHTRSGGSPRP